MTVWPPSASLYGTLLLVSFCVTAAASLGCRLLNSGVYVGFDAQLLKNMPPMAKATTARPVMTFCPVENPDMVWLALRRSCSTFNCIRCSSPAMDGRLPQSIRSESRAAEPALPVGGADESEPQDAASEPLDRHPHDVVEGVNRLVADGDSELRGERRLGAGDHVVVDVVEVAGGGLCRHGVRLGLGLLDTLQGAVDDVSEAARAALGACHLGGG